MTIPNHELCITPTKELATLHKFYPVKISVPHHQLRHYISTADGDLIYYVTVNDLFALDLSTQQNSLIATIPFEARCLAADLGWVCVGGEQNGDCAFIKVEKDEYDRPTCFGHDMNVDLLGGEIVNSMNIHTMLNDGKTPDEPVVLISNNDKSVKIYSLAQRQVLTVLPHPVPMNFAALSPDSTVVAAVGDSDKVYFYRRRLDEHLDLIDDTPGRYTRYDWDSFAEPTVPTGDPVYDDYSFAVAFSPSGHLCASSSQGGSITVFDMHHLLNSDGPPEKSILCTFRSSRPTLWGCVRAMAFSPTPWDLLAWAEDHGRIGLADVRQYFIRRQVLELDKEKAEKVELDDGTPVAYRNLGHKELLKQQHLARLRAMRGLSSRDIERELSMDDLPSESGRRNNRPDLLGSSHSLDLDARERSVIEALETTMGNMEHLTTRPYSINYNSSPRWTGGRTSTDPNGSNFGSRPTGSRSHQPRRRTSVVLSESSANSSRYLDINESQRTRLSTSPGRMGDDDDILIMSTNDLTPSTSGVASQRQPSNIPASDPWHVIQTALETARASDNSNRANLARIEAALEAERQLGNQLERQLADERQLSQLLRRQLDTQQRLLLENSNQLEHLRAAARESNARVEASLERVLQRQLATEQQFLQQRSEELQSELRVGTDYSRRLESERERLLGGDSGRELPTNNNPGSADSNSAQTTALPTTNLRSPDPADNLSSILTDYRESRHQRLAHIENLQRQVRRAESRVALAAIDIQALETAVHRENNAEEPQSSGRTLAAITASRAANFDSSDSTTTTSRPSSTQPLPPLPEPTRTPARRAQISASLERELRLENRRSEIAGRVPDTDMRLARMMFLSGMSGNRSLDANGNWMPGSGLHRVLAGGASLSAGGGSVVVVGGARGVSSSEVAREMGPGTAGIGFSPDGRFL